MKTISQFLLPKSLILLSVVMVLLSPFWTKAQNQTNINSLNYGRDQLEHPTGSYIESPRETHPRSKAYSFRSTGFSIVQVNIDDNGFNIVDDAANEPSIACDPDNPDNMIIGWRQFDNINNSFRQAGMGYTTDGGESWTFPGVIDPGVFRSDPVLGHDGRGNFYYNSLTSANDDYWTNVYKSSDIGETWEMGTYSHGGDKQWMTIDRSQGVGGGNIYEFWNGTYSVCSPYNFTRSTDGNENYEACSSIPGDPYWGTTCVGPDGTLFVCGAQWNGLMVARSSNAKYPGEEVVWDFAVGVSLGGQVIGFGGDDCPNPNGLLGQAIISVDSSDGPGYGNVYLLCSVDRTTSIDPCDVMFAKSTDGGLTWENPVKVNDDTGNNAWQWFGTMSIAPDGRIDAIWLDSRDNFGSVNSSLYYSYSLDQGETWSENERLSDSFDPHIGWPQQAKMGDYFDMFSDDKGAHLAWAATFNGEQDVYYSLITPSYVSINDPDNLQSNFKLNNVPNPCSDHTYIRYQLPQKEFVSLKVFSVGGQIVETLVNGIQDKGEQVVLFNVDDLPAGVYFYCLEASGFAETKRIIVIK